MHVLGFTQRDLGHSEEALKTLNNLIIKNPTYYPALNHIGYAHLSLQQNEDALKSFNLFLESDSLNPSAFDSLAEGLAEMKEYDMAIFYSCPWQQCVDIAPHKLCSIYMH